MKRTHENYIKVMKAMQKNLRAIADMYDRQGKADKAWAEKREALGLATAIALLEDKDYFDKTVELFKLE